ncbi:uncharacterized protein [Drosophila bipectinata]|uniref:uncharacterized protein n=1 Tax=Drosophila bipectinata TaxID=42026 RepID=UPI001C891B85|nr:uncharacterized protein LOC108124544 [Drosophila bipectinata]
MRFHLQLSIILLGFLFVLQGFCHTLPEKKIRTTRDTINIPTHLFKPVEENPEIIKDNSYRQGNGTNAENDNNASLLARSSGVSGEDPRLLERSSGGVETVSGEEEDEGELIPNLPQQYFPPNLRSNSRFPNQDFRSRPSIDVDPRVQFSSRPVFGDNSWPPNTELPRPRIPNNQFRPPIRSSLTPFIAGGQNEDPSATARDGFIRAFNNAQGRTFYQPNNPMRGPSFLNGSGESPFPSPMGPSSSSNNFFRSESYSYTSDGHGPPQVETSVYDSRNGNGFGSSVRRNF